MTVSHWVKDVLTSLLIDNFPNKLCLVNFLSLEKKLFCETVKNQALCDYWAKNPFFLCAFLSINCFPCVWVVLPLMYHSSIMSKIFLGLLIWILLSFESVSIILDNTFELSNHLTKNKKIKWMLNVLTIFIKQGLLWFFSTITHTNTHTHTQKYLIWAIATVIVPVALPHGVDAQSVGTLVLLVRARLCTHLISKYIFQHFGSMWYL